MKIELKKWNEAAFEDIGNIFTFCDRSFLSNGIPMPYTAENAKAWYETTVFGSDESTGLYRIVFADGRAVGAVTLACGSDIYARDADLGYLLLKEYEGGGIMSRAVELFCKEAFEKLDILRISARVFSENTASCRILEKNGFEKEGCLRSAVDKNGKIYDMYIWGRLKETDG